MEELFGLIVDMRARGVTVLMIEQNAKRALESRISELLLELGSTRLQDPRRASLPIRASDNCFSAAGWNQRLRRSAGGAKESVT